MKHLLIPASRFNASCCYFWQFFGFLPTGCVMALLRDLCFVCFTSCLLQVMMWVDLNQESREHLASLLVARKLCALHYLVSICTRSGLIADGVTDLVAVADRSRGGPARAIRTPPGAKRCSTCAKRSGDGMPSSCFAGLWIWVWGQGWSAGGVCVRGGSGWGQRVKGAGSELLFEVWGRVCWEADVCVTVCLSSQSQMFFGMKYIQ